MWRFLKKLGIKDHMTQQPHYWAYTLEKNITDRDTRVPVLTAAPATGGQDTEAAQTSIDRGRINKLWCVHTVERQHHPPTGNKNQRIHLCNRMHDAENPGAEEKKSERKRSPY